MAIVLRTPTPIGHREHRGGTQEHEMFGGIRCSPAGTSAFHIGVCRLDSSIPADRTLMSEDALDSLSGCRDRYTPPTERVCADSGTQTLGAGAIQDCGGRAGDPRRVLFRSGRDPGVRVRAEWKVATETNGMSSRGLRTRERTED